MADVPRGVIPNQGERLRAALAKRRRVRRRLATGAAAAAAIGLALAPLLWPRRPLLVWNASASSPRGLYRVEPPGGLEVGDMAVAWPPAGARSLAAARGYLPANVPLVKRVAAVAGDSVCARGAALFVNGRAAAMRRGRDPLGRTLPHWRGCRALGPGEFLLLSRGAAGAFDGRYFGPVGRRQVVGRATPLWTW